MTPTDPRIASSSKTAPSANATAEPYKGQTVLVVDDSKFVRSVLTRILKQILGVTVVEARNGMQALELFRQSKPDAVLLDLQLPRMTGYEVLDAIMTESPIPIVVITGLPESETGGGEAARKAGAVGYIQKPGGPNSPQISTIQTDIANVVGKALALKQALKPRPRVEKYFKPKPVARPGPIGVIVSSAGGPKALTEVLSGIDTSTPPILIVQHMPEGFTASLAKRLDLVSPVCVKEAEANEQLMMNTVYVAPANKHMVLKRKSTYGLGYKNIRIALTDDPRMHGVRPAADLTLMSVAAIFNKNIVAAVLTGMGKDGTEGCKAIKEAGGTVIAQDEETSAVFGMPRHVIENGLADHIVPLPMVAQQFLSCIAEKTMAQKLKQRKREQPREE